MATTIINYTGDGVSTDYTVNFTGGYLTREGIRFTVDGSPVGVTWVSDGIIRFNEPPPNGSSVKIERVTNVESLVNRYKDGSTMTEANLDESFSQAILKLQELHNRLVELESE